jgi:predicted lipid-binding transport protein (Tim44 family)
VTKGQALLIGLAVLGLGGLGYGLFQASGFEGFNAGIAASSLLMVLVLGWTATYLLRAVTGNMTYMQQRRTYRSAYDAHTTEVLQRKFDALSPEEQQQLLDQVAEQQSPGEA